jgi:hypothetical protein
MGRTVIGVVGGCGGVGASRFAAVLAAAATADGGRALLADLDPIGGGIDVLVGAEALPGPHWSQLHLAGGALDPQLLLTGLPAWGRVALLSGRDDDLPLPDVVEQVLDVAGAVVPVVIDLSRWPSPARAAALSRCSIVALLSACDLPAITAARVVRAGLGAVPVAVISRGPRGAAGRVADLIGAPAAARLPSLRRRDGVALGSGALPRQMRQVALGVLQALDSPWDRSGVPAGESPGWMPSLKVVRND